MPANRDRVALVQAWVPHAMAAKLRARAEADDRSVAAELRRAIREHLRTSEAAGQGGSAKTRMTVRGDESQ